MSQPQQPVLGIDAAWTPAQPTGVALIVKVGGRWSLVAVAPCYEHFLDPVGLRTARPRGSRADPAALVERATELAGIPPVLIAVDMPLSAKVISARRAADNAISAAFGRRGCGTHSPSPVRPGLIAWGMLTDLSAAGYPLATTLIDGPATIEVYPHPALLVLTDDAYRLPYKIGRERSYWRDIDPAQRRLNLMAVWRRIVTALDREVDNVARQLVIPDPASPTWALKSFEDMLDAIVCAWAGVCAMAGHSRPFGDADAAIWVPERRLEIAEGATQRRQTGAAAEGRRL